MVLNDKPPFSVWHYGEQIASCTSKEAAEAVMRLWTVEPPPKRPVHAVILVNAFYVNKCSSSCAGDWTHAPSEVTCPDCMDNTPPPFPGPRC